MSVIIQVENPGKYDRLDLIGGGTPREDLGLVGQGPRPATATASAANSGPCATSAFRATRA